MQEPKVSVIIPVYKTAKYLRKCLDSVLNQTLQDFEIILVSDGPEEDDKICEEYVAKDNRISLIKGVNKGLGGARNAGIEASTAPYLSFIDSDDWVEPDFLQKMYEGMVQGADIVQCGTNIVFEGVINQELKRNDDSYFAIKYSGMISLKDDIFGSINVGTWNKLYRKDLINEYNLKFPENLRNEDAYFTWVYWSVCKNMYCIPDKLYNYLRRDDSLMAKTFAKDMGEEVLDHLKVGELLYNFLEKNSLFNSRKNAFFNSYYVCYRFVIDNGSEKYKEMGHEMAQSFLKNFHIPSKYSSLKRIQKKSYREFDQNHLDNSIFQNIFSIRNTPDKSHKVLTILGIRIKFKRDKKVKYKKCEEKHKISVVMPTYNAEKYLRRAIDSILNQTFTDFEFLIIDDNSTDKTREIINSYEDERIRLIEGDCRGLAAALNKGIKEAKGEYVARMDADDISLPERFEKQIAFLETNPNISLVGSWQQHFGKSHWIHKPAQNSEEVKGKMIFGCDLCHSTIMFRKDDFVNNNLFYPENSLQEDLELWHKALKKLNFSNLQEILGMYRVSNSSVTNKKENALIDYEASLVAKNISENFDIDINSINKELIMKRENQFLKKTKKEKIQFQKDLDKLYTLIEKQNKKTKYIKPKILRKVLMWNWTEMCRDCCYIKTKYYQECTFIEKIFSMRNRNNYKVIFVLGIKIKIKRDKFKKNIRNILSIKNADKYDYIIPIGTDCLTAEALKSIGIRTESLPFDWLYHRGEDFFVSAIDCIISDFTYFFNFSDLRIIGKCEDHNTWRCLNEKTGFHHIHDFPLKSNYVLDFKKVKNKYLRRIKRLQNILKFKSKILFVYMEQYQTPDNIFIEKMCALEKKFPFIDINLLILQHDNQKGETEYETVELSPNILKVQYNNDYKYSPKPEDTWWRNQKMYQKILLENICPLPKVSVVMPTYNAQEYIKEALDSILKQTMVNFEILIIDDKSSDKTLDIVKSYNDKRIRIIEGDCKGLAAALNKGIKEARGEYIARMDSDDISLPNRFSTQCDFLDKHSEISLIGSWQQHFGDSDFVHCPPANPDVAKLTLMLGCEMCHSTVMFRRMDFIENNLFYPENSPQEDYELWSEVIGKLNVANVPQVLGMYRVSSQSITNDKLDILDNYEAELSIKNLKKYLGIDLPKEDIDLVQKRNNPYWQMDIKGKRNFQKRLYNLYKNIEKQNKKYNFVNNKNIRKALCHNWRIMCGKECYIHCPYASCKSSIIKQIFSIRNEYKNNVKYKVITILGINITKKIK